MSRVMALGIIFLLTTSLALADPVVSNVRASQRTDGTGTVDVWYNLSGATGPCYVAICFSNDNGSHWNVLPSIQMLAGDYGNGITNGVDRHIVWDAGRERPQVYWPQTKVKITASETGQTISIMLPGLVPLEMVRIPAGSFIMGSYYDASFQSNEYPAHMVTIPNDFYLSKFEVTEAQWAAIMLSNPANQGNDFPIVSVSWNTIQTFLTQLNTLGQGTFRLPSEAEWEYACRAGSDTKWFFGNNEAQLTDYAWYTANNTPSGTKTVGTKLPNAWGLYDMHGNVWEWVQDWYHSTYTDAPTDGSAWESPTGTYRVLRGGAYSFTAANCRSAYRSNSSTSLYANPYYFSGIRLLRTP